jgi:hypothetical protein
MVLLLVPPPLPTTMTIAVSFSCLHVVVVAHECDVRLQEVFGGRLNYANCHVAVIWREIYPANCHVAVLTRGSDLADRAHRYRIATPPILRQSPPAIAAAILSLVPE